MCGIEIEKRTMVFVFRVWNRELKKEKEREGEKERAGGRETSEGVTSFTQNAFSLPRARPLSPRALKKTCFFINLRTRVIPTSSRNGGLAQMAERVLSMHEAQGSIPWSSTFLVQFSSNSVPSNLVVAQKNFGQDREKIKSFGKSGRTWAQNH